ncbi:hypothetical protein NEIELOOT_00175 [Neisseria elongata subsp. glycolytica ATCC 29315]|uniref:Uncharacterized protein n=1 Tax=Neisseria elongata subsp. glycolytica ATCC 29315 TaxID=546263 RepID=D4DMB0_NEIEG|nr:hypothetical protein NEIELOOT_00175 [Neisseria elongata subsp. glycolytica ATCC 29315]
MLKVLSDTSIRPTVAAGRECDVTTHAVSRNAGYGLLIADSMFPKAFLPKSEIAAD